MPTTPLYRFLIAAKDQAARSARARAIPLLQLTRLLLLVLPGVHALGWWLTGPISWNFVGLGSGWSA